MFDKRFNQNRYSFCLDQIVSYKVGETLRVARSLYGMRKIWNKETYEIRKEPYENEKKKKLDRIRNFGQSLHTGYT